MLFNDWPLEMMVPPMMSQSELWAMLGTALDKSAMRRSTSKISHVQSCLLIAAVFVLVSAGCGGTPVEKISISRSNDPIDQARVWLKRYASGEPLGSEAVLLQSTAKEVARFDKNISAILESGFEAILRSPPSARAAIANELLRKIGDSSVAP